MTGGMVGCSLASEMLNGDISLLRSSVFGLIIFSSDEMKFCSCNPGQPRNLNQYSLNGRP